MTKGVETFFRSPFSLRSILFHYTYMCILVKDIEGCRLEIVACGRGLESEFKLRVLDAS